mmetsp:Transcript_9012/g.22744  ORF Transcript_9012/g.22744 Transcript_9012/m.22744 type:complete len:638 (+) Transcript_9012:298-2211(+)
MDTKNMPQHQQQQRDDRQGTSNDGIGAAGAGSQQHQHQEETTRQNSQQQHLAPSIPTEAAPAIPPMLGLIPLRSSSSAATAASSSIGYNINITNNNSNNGSNGDHNQKQQQYQYQQQLHQDSDQNQQQQQNPQQQQKQLEVKRFPIVLGRDNLAQWWYQSCNCGNYYCRLHCRPVAQNVGSLSKVMVQIGSNGDVHVVGKNPHLITIVSSTNSSTNSNSNNSATKQPKASTETGQELDQNKVLRENDILSIGRRDREPWMRFLVVRAPLPAAKQRGGPCHPSVPSLSQQKSDLAMKRQQEYDDIVTKLTKAVSDVVAARSAQDPAAAAAAADEFNTAANSAAHMYQQSTAPGNPENNNNNGNLNNETNNGNADMAMDNVDMEGRQDNRKRPRDGQNGIESGGQNKRMAVQQDQIGGNVYNNNNNNTKPLSEILQAENLNHNHSSKTRASRRTQIHLVVPDYKKSAQLLQATSRGQPGEWSRPRVDEVPVQSGQTGGEFVVDPNSSSNTHEKPKFYSYTANQKYPRRGNFLTAGPALVNEYPNIPSEEGEGVVDNTNAGSQGLGMSQEPTGNTTTGGDSSDPEPPQNDRNEPPPTGRPGGGASTNLQFLSQNYAAALLDMKNDEESQANVMLKEKRAS